MRVYLDSSAIVKLVQKEAESESLRRYLRRHRLDERVTSAVARVEVVRAVHGGGTSLSPRPDASWARVHQVSLDRTLLDTATALAPGTFAADP